MLHILHKKAKLLADPHASRQRVHDVPLPRLVWRFRCDFFVFSHHYSGYRIMFALLLGMRKAAEM